MEQVLPEVGLGLDVPMPHGHGYRPVLAFPCMLNLHYSAIFSKKFGKSDDVKGSYTLSPTLVAAYLQVPRRAAREAQDSKGKEYVQSTSRSSGEGLWNKYLILLVNRRLLRRDGSLSDFIRRNSYHHKEPKFDCTCRGAAGMRSGHRAHGREPRRPEVALVTSCLVLAVKWSAPFCEI